MPVATREPPRALGRDVALVERAYAVSALGTWLALDAFSLVAIRVLHAGPGQVSALAAAGGAAGALLAVPLGPAVEHRPKRPVLVRADLVRCLLLLTVPAAALLGVLTFVQLLLVAVGVAVADVVFVGANAAHLRGLVAPAELLRVSGRLETATWTATVVGPPLGGLLVGVAGPVATVTLNAGSFLLSRTALRGVRSPEPPPPARPAGTRRRTELVAGWRTIGGDPVLRLLFANGALVATLVLATGPLLAYRMLHDLAVPPWQYGLALGLPCLGGLLGARCARPLAQAYGRRRVLLAAGTLRVLALPGLALAGPGTGGLLLVLAVQAVVVTGSGVYAPLLATERLERAPAGSLVRLLTAWTVSTRTATAGVTALGGVLAAATSARTALLAAGLLLLPTPLLLPWRAPAA